MKFEEWWKRNCDLWNYPDNPQRLTEEGWKGCKEQALKILDKYSQTPAYPYIKEALEKEI